MYVLIMLFMLMCIFPEHVPEIIFFSIVFSPLLIVLYYITILIELIIKDALKK